MSSTHRGRMPYGAERVAVRRQLSGALIARMPASPGRAALRERSRREHDEGLGLLAASRLGYRSPAGRTSTCLITPRVARFAPCAREFACASMAALFQTTEPLQARSA